MVEAKVDETAVTVADLLTHIPLILLDVELHESGYIPIF